MSKHTAPLPDWELVHSSAIHAKHRFSRDADHVLTDLRSRFDIVLAQLGQLQVGKQPVLSAP